MSETTGAEPSPEPVAAAGGVAARRAAEPEARRQPSRSPRAGLGRARALGEPAPAEAPQAEEPQPEETDEP